MRSDQCIYPGCQYSRRTRGLCHGHYQTMRAAVRNGRVTERDLKDRGLLLPKGTGGCPAPDTLKAFVKGSEVTGQF